MSKRSRQAIPVSSTPPYWQSDAETVNASSIFHRNDRRNYAVTIASLFLLLFWPCYAAQEIFVNSESDSFLQESLLSLLERDPYSEYLAVKYSKDSSKESERVRVLQNSQNRDLGCDIRLFSAVIPPTKSAVYRYKGHPCDWKCDGFWIHIERRDSTRIAVVAIPINPMVAVGKGFNIHTFSFTPNWQRVPETPFDSLELRNHIANLLHQPRTEFKEIPPGIDLAKR